VRMSARVLLAVPNVSEGSDRTTIAAIRAGFMRQLSAGARPMAEAASAEADRVRLLDEHSDTDHERSVFTLAGGQRELVEAVLAGARVAIARVDIRDGRGVHPHVGALDVAPIVYLQQADRGAACAAALALASDLASELAIPVFVYGELTSEDGRPGSERTRAEIRRGGIAALAARMQSGELRPDFGPSRAHRTAGATLVGAREPLVAFNLELARPAGLAQARAIAARIREGGEEGLPGVRAIGVELRRTEGAVAQVSVNVERPREVALAAVVTAVSRHAQVAAGELVGMVPMVALEGFPQDLPMGRFDPSSQVIENALGF
jgi:glutamate formiminotransferase / 5-formyltetrahydrofolate cyclo-ligase